MFVGPGEGVLVFESPAAAADQVPASRVAQVLAERRVPVVVLNACQSGAVGKDLEAAVATRLLRRGRRVGGRDGLQRVRGGGGGVHGRVLRAAVRRGHGEPAVTAGRRQLYQQPGGRARRANCRWRTGWCRCITCAASQLPAGPHRPGRVCRRWTQALDEIRARRSAAARVPGTWTAAGGVFVGRDALFYELEAAARLQKVVVLPGPGGTGKTELAKAFGRWWRDTGGVDDPELGVLAFVRAGSGLVRPGRRDHRDRPAAVRHRFRPAGSGRAARRVQDSCWPSTGCC